MQGSCSSLKVKLIDQLMFCMLVFTACKELRTMYGKHNSSRHILEHSSVCLIEQARYTIVSSPDPPSTLQEERGVW